MRYNLFIGRYQSPHKGHMHIFNTFLNEDKPVLIAIRDIEPDTQNPLTAAEVKALWETIYKNNKLVKVIIIPDILSVNYGRGVGYEINQIDVPGSVSAISATDIRQQIIDGRQDWKTLVDENIHEMLTAYLTSKPA
jgi:Nicotinamide mononucleotide adenylyltransferase